MNTPHKQPAEPVIPTNALITGLFHIDAVSMQPLPWPNRLKLSFAVLRGYRPRIVIEDYRYNIEWHKNGVAL